MMQAAPCRKAPARKGKDRMVDPSARLAENVALGESCVIEAGVTIGAGSVIGHHAVICRDTQIGELSLIHIYGRICIRPSLF